MSVQSPPRRALARRVRGGLRRVGPARALRRAALAGVDGVEAALRRRPPLRPPRRLQGVGAGDFEAVGEEIMASLVALGGLRPSDRVLDVGCGTGRVAVPLTRHLAGGTYHGFDVDTEAVAWCREAISARHPRFRFDVLDLANSHYNPGGSGDAASVSFPYPSAAFDLVFATSVFTHLRAPAAVNYLAESARVLAPGGRLFATFFLLTGQSEAALADGRAGLALPHRARDEATGMRFRVMHERSPETAVAFAGDDVVDALERVGLRDIAVHPGTWAAQAAGTSYQDVVTARRPA